MSTAATTPSVGGERRVPLPDPIARDYILVALGLDQHVSGLVDGYFGPSDLKAQVETGQLRSPARLADDAAAVRARLPAEVDDASRRGWLDAQLVALEAQASALAGEDLPYVEHLARCFSWSPARRPEAHFEAAARELDGLVPGSGALAGRIASWDGRYVVAPDRLPSVVGWLVERFRARAAEVFGLPEGEELRVSFVRDRPWSGYNWYDGGLRSRVDLNLDLPRRADDLLTTVAHETFPGHHLEHAWKEADLVLVRGRLEASILLINTPECLISEGLADLGFRFAVPPGDDVDLLVELYERGGLPVASDPVAAREAAELTVAMRGPRDRLDEASVNAALMRHADGRPRDEVLAFLVGVGRMAPERAAKRLEFIEHPLWRTYVFVYDEGRALLERWVEAVPPAEQPGRFARLLHEQLTPGAIAAELDEPGRA